MKTKRTFDTAPDTISVAMTLPKKTELLGFSIGLLDGLGVPRDKAVIYEEIQDGLRVLAFEVRRELDIDFERDGIKNKTL